MVNKEHLNFLKEFPLLNDWLNCNGFTLIYTRKDEALDQIFSMWSDRTSQPGENGMTDAKNWLMITYCEQCKVVEVFSRVGMCQHKGKAETEEEAVGISMPELECDDLQL